MTRSLLWSLVATAALGLPAAAGDTPGPESEAVVVGLVPGPDPVRQAEVERGARAAAASFPEIRLVVGAGSGHWSGATAVIEKLLDDEGATILLAPPDREGAHLVAQIATRRHIPAIATAPFGSAVARSASGAGSWWLVVCEPLERAPRALESSLGRSPRELEVTAWAAIEVARKISRGGAPSAARPGSVWRTRLPSRCLRSSPGGSETMQLLTLPTDERSNLFPPVPVVPAPSTTTED